MNSLLFYGKNEYARSIWTKDLDDAYVVAKAMKKDGWKVVWMIHSFDSVRAQEGYEEAYNEWAKEVNKCSS